jgi:nitrite reductase/ring-hydroxylating ferredoxin subunit
MKILRLGTYKEHAMEMIPEKWVHKIHLDEHIVALVRRGKSFYAFQATCPNRGALLFRGSFTDEHEIICPLNRYRFDFKTGKIKLGSCGDLKIFSVEVHEDGLKIFFPSK